MPAFRGITAPASLKLVKATLDDLRARAFRGITAPASLKRQPPPAPAGGLAPFRGITAPASLKQSIISEKPIDLVSDFPGHYCPGLIEATKERAERAIEESFPGHYCPGLIEAGSLVIMQLEWQELSGALLPRPH